MAWLRKTSKLLQKLTESTNLYPDSELWNECCNAIEEIESKSKISPWSFDMFSPLVNEANKMLLQQKQLWITNEQSIKQILKHLIFHSTHSSMASLFESIARKPFEQERAWRAIAFVHNYCCTAFEKFHLMTHSARNTLLTIQFSGFTDRYSADKWKWIFWMAFFWLNDPANNGSFTASLDNMVRIIYGFVFVLGAKFIENMLSNKSEKELQKEMVSIWRSYRVEKLANIDVIKFSKVLIGWRNHKDIEEYGKMFIPHQLEQVTYNFAGFAGDIAFLYGMMHLRNKRYLDAKCKFIFVICNANSFVIMSLSLRSLSKICKDFGEYGIGLKCLKRAYKLCHIDNEICITPSFVARYDTKKRVFIKELNKMECGYCGKKKGIKLRCCSGCMKAMYCNKNCQKKHWKKVHKYDNNCDQKFWYTSRNYKMLKNAAIFNVKI